MHYYHTDRFRGRSVSLKRETASTPVEVNATPTRSAEPCGSAKKAAHCCAANIFSAASAGSNPLDARHAKDGDGSCPSIAAIC